MVISLKKILYCLIFITFLLISIHYQENLIIIKKGLTIYFEVLFPNMFISMVLIYLLYYVGFFTSLKYPFLTKLLNMNHQAIGFSLTCILLGFPLASVLIDETYNQHLLTKKQALRLFYCIHISKLSFIVNQCGMLLFHNLKLAFLLYFVQLFSIIILLFLTRHTSIHLTTLTNKPFSTSLNLAFIQSITSLFYIGGYYLMILCIYEIANLYLPSFITSILAFLLEISNGIILLQNSAITIPLLFIITSIYLMFASFSIHLQIFSMITYLKVSYFTFIKYRLLHLFIIILLCMIIAIFFSYDFLFDYANK